MGMKKVLVVGSGAREHAIALKLAESDLVEKVFVAPGNPGMLYPMAHSSKIELRPSAGLNNESLLGFAKESEIDLTVIGPEALLSSGIVDLFLKNNLLILGPTKRAGLLETSKNYAKKIMMKSLVPTASYSEFTNSKEALAYIENYPYEQVVVKCDGLASGKGVIVCQNKSEAKNAIIALMEKKLLGENASCILIEEFLEGPEVSAFALCDGESFSFLGTASDHKRLRDGDDGPNTGGMGVFSPAGHFTLADELWISEHVISKILKTMKEEGTPFFGILFAGLIKTRNGWKVIEFNVRFGDPETEVLLPLIQDDLYPWFEAAANGNILELQNKLGRVSPLKKSLVGVHVVKAAFGYPGTEGIAIRSGDPIHINPNFSLGSYDYLFFAGVKKQGEVLETSGGRILGITSLRENFKEARENAYHLISEVNFKDAQYRNDIAINEA